MAPSEPYDDGYRSRVWVAQIAAAHRIWYVGTDYLSRDEDPVYRALDRAG